MPKTFRCSGIRRAKSSSIRRANKARNPHQKHAKRNLYLRGTGSAMHKESRQTMLKHSEHIGRHWKFRGGSWELLRKLLGKFLVRAWETHVKALGEGFLGRLLGRLLCKLLGRLLATPFWKLQGNCWGRLLGGSWRCSRGGSWGGSWKSSWEGS